MLLMNARFPGSQAVLERTRLLRETIICKNILNAGNVNKKE